MAVVRSTRGGFGRSSEILVDTSQLQHLEADLVEINRKVRRESLEEIRKIRRKGLFVAREVVPIFQGDLKLSLDVVKTKVIDSPGGFVFLSGISSDRPPYDEVMEEGRHPGRKGPPLSAMKKWIALKAQRGYFHIPTRVGEDPRKSLTRAAFRLQKSISIKGTKGRRFMARAHAVMQAETVTRFNALVARWVAWFERGK